MDLKNQTEAGGAAVPRPDLAQARALIAQGKYAAAAPLLEEVLRKAPGDVEALNLSGTAAVQAGRFEEARELLRRALVAAPNDVLTLCNLGMSYRAASNWGGALDAYRRARSLQSDLYFARLHEGESLERLGRTHEALLAYMGAIRHAQAHGRWLNAATTGAGVRPLVEHAVAYVRRGQRELFERLIQPLRKEHGRAALTRVDACLAVYLGERSLELPDPRQRPTFLFFPGLRPQPYFPRQMFDWMGAFEACTDAIRVELRERLAAGQGREAVFQQPEAAEQNLRNAIGAKPQWDGLYFYRHGERRIDNCAACPGTAEALETLPLARVPRHAPEVMFSVLEPGTHLLPHRGVTNTRLVLHLPLIVPPDCALNVAGQIHEWREGRGVVFDDTYEHEAWNRSSETRVVLIADIWNPQLTDVERAAISALVVAMGELREAVDGSHVDVSGH